MLPLQRSVQERMREGVKLQECATELLRADISAVHNIMLPLT